MFTGIIVAITCIVSILCFSNEALKEKLLFYPFFMKRDNEWYRFFTSGFIHSDPTHLIFNMISLYSIGSAVESRFKYEFGDYGISLYIAMYFLAIPIASLFDFFKHKDNPSYRALGASGAVSAVIYSGVLFFPWAVIRVFFAIPIWFWLFGVLYLIFSAYMAKQGRDNIGHYAHFFGGIFGLAVPCAIHPYLISEFIYTILSHRIF